MLFVWLPLLFLLLLFLLMLLMVVLPPALLPGQGISAMYRSAWFFVAASPLSIVIALQQVQRQVIERSFESAARALVAQGRLDPALLEKAEEEIEEQEGE